MKKRERWTFTEWFNVFLGKKFVMNAGTGEIHSLAHKHKNCHLDLITHKEYMKEDAVADWLEDESADGCRFCFKEQDNG